MESSKATSRSNFAVKNGFSRDLFIPVHKGALSTVDEARNVMIPVLRQMGVHKLLLVTSEFHTARSGRIYRREARDIETHMVAADTYFWDHGMWWKNREGRKIWVTETAEDNRRLVRHLKNAAGSRNYKVFRNS